LVPFYKYSPLPYPGDLTRISLTTCDANSSGDILFFAWFQAADDWHDVLREVSSGDSNLSLLTAVGNELKKIWKDGQEEGEGDHYELSNAVDGTSLLFSQLQRADVAEVIASLPPKPEIDRQIAPIVL
jgi:hypothetical protein